MAIDFTGKTAIVTGAGGGLGRAHAIDLAARGANVVVNDLGGSRDGTGASDAALQVVEEIKAAGGCAIANGGSVTDFAAMQAMVEEAKAAFGGVHILINNAGILRDKSFAKMDMADFQTVIDVHLIGTANCTKAVWDTMRDQGYGRILMTSSSSGLYGNFGQANYAAAKMGMIGFAKTLGLEGARYDIRVNALFPVGATRMTEDIMPAEVLSHFTPESAAAAAVFLVSDDAPQGAIIGAGGGGYHAAYVTMTRGVLLPEGARTADDVAANWDAITTRNGETVPTQGGAQAMQVMTMLNAGLNGG
jgi:NAD(P)-dependent dehydrogenase (short-subunit alcohol dehydrogenase family)